MMIMIMTTTIIVIVSNNNDGNIRSSKSIIHRNDLKKTVHGAPESPKTVKRSG